MLNTHTHRHTYTCMIIITCTLTWIHTSCMYAYTIHIGTHAYINTYMHTYMHTYKHSYIGFIYINSPERLYTHIQEGGNFALLYFISRPGE